MKILAIADFFGQHDLVDVDSFRSAASFLDYDAVVIDFSGIIHEYETMFDTNYQGRTYLNEYEAAQLMSDLGQRRSEAEEMLSLGRTLVVFTPSPQTYLVDTGRREVPRAARNLEPKPILTEIDLLSIMPVEVRTTQSRGRNIEFSGQEPFASFGDKNRGRMEYRAYFTETVGTPLWTVKGTSRVVGSYLPYERGHIVFSPAYADPEEDEAQELAFFESIEALVKELSRSAGNSALPSWCHDYELPGENHLQRELEKSKSEMKELIARIEEQETVITELQEYKVLISGTGRALELQVRKVMEELGFEVTEGSRGRDDLILRHDDKLAVVEVKGVGKSAAEKHAAQLEKWVSEKLLSTGAAPKGILIVNAQKDIPLSDRTEAPFPQQMMAYSENRGHCLLTGIQLLGIYLYCKENPDQKQSVVDRLLTTNGRFQGFDDWSSFVTHRLQTPDTQG